MSPIPPVVYAVSRDSQELRPFLEQWIPKAATRLGIRAINTVVMHLDDLKALADELKALDIQEEQTDRRICHRAYLGEIELVAITRTTQTGAYQAVQPGVLYLGHIHREGDGQ